MCVIEMVDEMNELFENVNNTNVKDDSNIQFSVDEEKEILTDFQSILDAI